MASPACAGWSSTRRAPPWWAAATSHLRTEGWEFILAPEARDNQNVALASPLRLKGGSGRPASAALEPNLCQAADRGSRRRPEPDGADQPGGPPDRRQSPAPTVAPRVEALRPGLRAQMPVPSADLRAAAVAAPADGPTPQRCRRAASARSHEALLQGDSGRAGRGRLSRAARRQAHAHARQGGPGRADAGRWPRRSPPNGAACRTRRRSMPPTCR